MLQKKTEICHRITELCKQHLANRDFINSKVNELKVQFNVPEGIANDLLTLRTHAEDATDDILYYLLSVLDEKHLSNYFNEVEINLFKGSKCKSNKIKFPLALNMVQIRDDQWIGKISVATLMKLRDAQLINYNDNAQRTLRHVVSGGMEYYQIDLNRNAVKAIMDSYSSTTYIPNTLTFNIRGGNNDYYYDEDTHELIIKKLESLDILDGYHRYIAISNLYNLDHKFDYDMEVRIVDFTEELARQFIWQEDQKTKMRKVDSDTLNQNRPGTQVVNNLKKLKSMQEYIDRNTGVINEAELMHVVNYVCFDNAKTAEKSRLYEVEDRLEDRFNYFFRKSPEEIRNTKWKFSFILCATYILYKTDKENDLYETICNIEEELKKRNHREVYVTTFNQTHMKLIEEILTEMEV